MHASNVRTSFAGLFIKNNARTIVHPRGSARHCWAVCDPRPGRAETVAAPKPKTIRSIWPAVTEGATN
jgi:hypothetical protein